MDFWGQRFEERIRDTIGERRLRAVNRTADGVSVRDQLRRPVACHCYACVALILCVVKYIIVSRETAASFYHHGLDRLLFDKYLASSIASLAPSNAASPGTPRHQQTTELRPANRLYVRGLSPFSIAATFCPTVSDEACSGHIVRFAGACPLSSVRVRA